MRLGHPAPSDGPLVAPGLAGAGIAGVSGAGGDAGALTATSLSALLETKLRIAFRHREIASALAMLNQRLPPGVFLACDYPVDCGSDASPAMARGISWSSGATAQPVRAVLDTIAVQCGLRWQVLRGHIVFLRRLPPRQREEWSALVARIKDPAVTDEGFDAIVGKMQAMTWASDDPDALRDIAMMALDRSQPRLAQRWQDHSSQWISEELSQGNSGMVYGPWAATDSPAMRAVVEAAGTEGAQGEEAVLIAGQIGDAAVVPGALRYLQANPGPKARKVGGMVILSNGQWLVYVHALEQIGGPQVAAAGKSLLSLASPCNDICSLAASSGEPSLQAPLTALMSRPDFRSYALGNQALDALAMLPESAIGALIRGWMASGERSDDVAAAACALESWGHARDAALLRPRLADHALDDRARFCLVHALARLGDAGDIPALLDVADSLPQRSSHPSDRRAFDLAEAVVDALAAMPDAAEPALARAASTIVDPGRLALLSLALARSANPDAIADLAAALNAHASGPGRDRLLIAAAGSGDVRCEALAIATLLHGGCTDQQRDALLAALRDSREPATIAALLGLLSPAVPKELRLAVLRHLPTMPGLDLGGTLRQLIAAPATDPQMRGSAILAMPDASRAQSADVLQRLMASDREPFVRACAAAIMPADQAPALIAALGGDPSPLVRCFAAARLTPAGGSDAIAALEQALGDADPAVRTTAAQALSEEVCCGAAAVQAQVGERLRRQAGIESDGQVLQAIQQAERGCSPAAAAPGTACEIIGHQSMTNFAGPTWSTPMYAPIYTSDPAAPPSRPFGHG